RCVDYSKQLENQKLKISTQGACFSKCLTNYNINALNMVPFRVINTKLLNYKVVSELTIASNASLLHFLEDKCSAKCSYSDCLKTISITQADAFQNGEFLLRVHSPIEPFFSIELMKMTSIAELLLYILSCAGTWFGFTIFAIQKSIIESFDVNRIAHYL